MPQCGCLVRHILVYVYLVRHPLNDVHSGLVSSTLNLLEEYFRYAFGYSKLSSNILSMFLNILYYFQKF